MAEENQAQAEEQVQENEPKDQKIDEIVSSKVAEKLAEVEKNYKSQISGLDKRNSELEKMLKQKEESSLTEAEKLRRDMDELKAMAEAERMQRVELEAATAAGLDMEWLKATKIQDPVERAAKIAELMKSSQNKALEDFKKKLGRNVEPGGEEQPTGKFMKRAQFDKLDPAARMAVLKDGTKIIN